MRRRKGDGLTPRQRETLGSIADSIRATGRPPAIREIGAALGITTNAVSCKIDALVAKGLVRRTKAGTRNLELTEKALCTTAVVPINRGPLPVRHLCELLLISLCEHLGIATPEEVHSGAAFRRMHRIAPDTPVLWAMVKELERYGIARRHTPVGAENLWSLHPGGLQLIVD